MSQYERGKRWYADAYNFCATLARHHKKDVKTVAGIVAALSPMCRWELNLLGAMSVLKTRRFPRQGTYPANQDKALRILDGELPSKVLGGMKVINFYLNILRPHGAQVTIDRHMLALAGLTHSPTVKQYKKLMSIVIDESKHVGLKPAQYQAVCWLVQREKDEFKEPQHYIEWNDEWKY